MQYLITERMQSVNRAHTERITERKQSVYIAWFLLNIVNDQLIAKYIMNYKEVSMLTVNFIDR